jgi:hypothetical protein
MLQLFRAIVSGIVLCLAMPGFAQQSFCDLDNLLECTQISAQKLASEYPQIFRLKNGELEVRQQAKQMSLKMLTETNLELYPDEQLTYPIQYWPLRNWLLVKQFADGGETQIFEMIDLAHDFKKTELNGSPVFSADGKRLLAYGADIYAGFTANGIAVYSIDKEGLTEEIKIDEQWGVIEARWNGDHEIILSTIELCETPNATRNEHGECLDEKKLALVNNQWKLITDSSLNYGANQYHITARTERIKYRAFNASGDLCNPARHCSSGLVIWPGCFYQSDTGRFFLCLF